MQKKSIKKEKKVNSEYQYVRINNSSRSLGDSILKKANNKKQGRTIKLFQLIELGLQKITDKDVLRLQEASLTADDLNEKMRQFYIKKNHQISPREFKDFQIKIEYIDFLKSYHEEMKSSEI